MRTTLTSLLTALAVASALAAPALAGPSLTGIESTRIQGTAQFNTSYGESFSVTGTTTAAITPFTTTTGITLVPAVPAVLDPNDPTIVITPGSPASPAPAAPTNVGNVGTAVLAVTFLTAGDGIAGGTGQQVQSTSGIIQLGGSSTIGGMMAFNTPSAIILDQSNISAISIGAGENVGASNAGTQVGTSSLNADVTIVNQTINLLSVF